jgi:hypothetical protein
MQGFFNACMSDLYDSSVPWASDVLEITSRSGWTTKVYKPLIRHRWPFYAEDPVAALDQLQKLPASTIACTLKHLYAHTPLPRGMLASLKSCRIVESPESQHPRDMAAFLADKASTDFSLLSRDCDDPVRLHRFMLAVRSGFFRRRFREDSALTELRDPDMCHEAVEMFARYLYTGKVVLGDIVAAVDLFGAGAKYELSDPEEIDFLALKAIQASLSPQTAGEVLARATERRLTLVIDFVLKYFPL